MSEHLRLFLCGDVMLGRGIDQVLPHRGDPRLYEPQAASAETYVELAERLNGPIRRPVDFAYVWGDALPALDRARPDLRIINLETSITTCRIPVLKGINYKMNPANAPCLVAAGVDCCVLANNHVLDWGRVGLVETLETLEKSGIGVAGAGRNAEQAEAPAALRLSDGGEVLVFGFGSVTSGIPEGWLAGPATAGINLLKDISDRSLEQIAIRTRAMKRQGRLLVASVHWGSNWGYEVPHMQQDFAHGLIDHAGFDIVHGHSSHHPKAIEIYRNHLILYGCGDFLNDYEGIKGYESFRGDLVLMYLVLVSTATGKLLALELTPFQIKQFRLNHVPRTDAVWLSQMLERESARFGTRVEVTKDDCLTVTRQGSI